MYGTNIILKQSFEKITVYSKIVKIVNENMRTSGQQMSIKQSCIQGVLPIKTLLRIMTLIQSIRIRSNIRYFVYHSSETTYIEVTITD